MEYEYASGEAVPCCPYRPCLYIDHVQDQPYHAMQQLMMTHHVHEQQTAVATHRSASLQGLRLQDTPHRLKQYAITSWCSPPLPCHQTNIQHYSTGNFKLPQRCQHCSATGGQHCSATAVVEFTWQVARVASFCCSSALSSPCLAWASASPCRCCALMARASSSSCNKQSSQRNSREAQGGMKLSPTVMTACCKSNERSNAGLKDACHTHNCTQCDGNLRNPCTTAPSWNPACIKPVHHGQVDSSACYRSALLSKSNHRLP